MRTVKRTLSSGREVEMVEVAGVRGLILSGILTDELSVTLGKMEDSKRTTLLEVTEFEQAITCSMWVTPRVVPYGETPKKGEVAFTTLENEEVSETITLGLRGLAEADRFRELARGARSSIDGESVGGDAVPAARNGRGKPAGVPAGRKPRAATSRGAK